MLRDVRSAVAANHPIDLLFTVSQLVELATERPLDRWKHATAELPSLGELVTSFVEVDRFETTALLVAVGATAR